MPRKRRTFEEFLEVVRERHDDKYSYDPNTYDLKKLDILCPVHGWFSQTPKKHIEGQGCKKCSAERRGDMLRMSQGGLISKFREVHGNKYVYEDAFGSDYKNVDSFIKITCPVHGSFKQTAQKHLKGQGCSKCRDQGLSDMRLEPYEKLVSKIEDLHDGLVYCDGFDGDYVGQRTVLRMICNRCGGSFSGYGHNILRGQSCPTCSEYGYSNIASTNFISLYSPCYLYILKISWVGRVCYKVGISSTTRFRSRLVSIASESKSDKCVCVGLYKSTRFDCLTKEQSFHRKYKNLRDTPCTKYVGWTEVYKEDVTCELDNLIREIESSGTFEKQELP